MRSQLFLLVEQQVGEASVSQMTILGDIHFYDVVQNQG